MVSSKAPRDSQYLRKKVAREAAFLIYTSQEKEYKQAKIRAAKILGARVLPSNREVAEELDAIAAEHEGQARFERLLLMRREALEIMQCLKHYNPKLIGSVWRGTIHRNSDIDIIVFSSNVEEVVRKLQEKGFKVTEVEEVLITKKGSKQSSFHVFLSLPSGNEAEIVIRSPEEETKIEKCEIYGDIVTGLNLDHLKNVLKNDPYKRFIPD